MRTMLLVAIILLAMVTVAMGQETQSLWCPDVQVTCNCNGPYPLEGYYAGKIEGIRRCGILVALPGMGVWEFHEIGRKFVTRLTPADNKTLKHQFEPCEFDGELTK